MAKGRRLAGMAMALVALALSVCGKKDAAPAAPPVDGGAQGAVLPTVTKAVTESREF